MEVSLRDVLKEVAAAIPEDVHPNGIIKTAFYGTEAKSEKLGRRLEKRASRTLLVASSKTNSTE